MHPTPDQDLDQITVSWLGTFVDELLIMLAVVGGLAVAASISRTPFTGWLPIYNMHIGSLVLTLGVTMARRRISARAKATYVTVVTLLVAASSIYVTGLMSGGVWFFPVAVLLLALFAKRRVALWLTALIMAYLVLVGMGFIGGTIKLPAPAEIIALSMQQWSVFIIGTAFFFTSLLLMVTHYRHSVAGLVAEVRRQRDEIARLADFDALTGLPVLRLATDRLEQACKNAGRHGGMVALLFIDLDGFKEVNDHAGHEAGDHCLAAVAKRLTESLRAADTASRFGGDEFVVMLPDVADAAAAGQIAAKLIAAISEPITFAGERLMLSASIGVALFPDDARDAAGLIRRADHAMYTVKRAGKHDFAFAGAAPAPALLQ